MARVILWWAFFAILLIGTSLFRYHIRHNYGTSATHARLVPAIEALLRGNNYTITHEINDDHEGHIGFEFTHPSCTKDMRVIAFTIGTLADPFSDDYMTPEDQRRYFYYDLSYLSSARIATTLTWAKYKIKDRLMFNPTRTSSRQIVVIWPGTCPAPNINWSRAWTPHPETENS